MRAADNRRAPAPSNADGNELPIDAVALDLAAQILGCGQSSAVRLLVDVGLLDGGDGSERSVSRVTDLDVVARADVEQVALTVYRWRDHLDDIDTYWISGNRAATMLGVKSSRLQALSARGFLPF